MSITIVVDANIILSALLGGKSGSILFDKRFQFTTTEFTISEVKKYIPELARKLSVEQRKVEKSLELLPLQRYQRSTYEPAVQEAEDMIGGIDPKDVDILALALWLQAYLWSQDRHFEKARYDKLLKTHDLMG